MPKVKFQHIVSCSSEDPEFPARNLLNNDTSKKWKCRTAGESIASVIIQLEKEIKITGIDIGNEYTVFIEVLVGRSSTPDAEYQMILPCSSLMGILEARNGLNSNRVRMFTSDNLYDPVREEKWDRIKVVCRQEVNKHVQFGLSFITIHTPQELNTSDEQPLFLGKFKIRPESPDILTPGSLFALKKELDKQQENVVQEIRNTTCTPKTKFTTAINSPSGSGTKTDSTSKNRNRPDLFYNSDDEKTNDKLNKFIAMAQDEDEKQKVETAKTKKPTKTPKKETKINAATPEKNEQFEKKITNKRKTESPKNLRKKIKLETRPFYQLFGGVVFTISGIVNPERANLRQLALNMGAKYRQDWDNTCTHLICAFANTPKFQQVRGKGKIVKKSWITDCHTQRKRLPWRRYALDKNDQGKPESEDEIGEKIDEPEELNMPDEEPVPSTSSKNPLRTTTKYDDNSTDADTDDEIEKILAKENARNNHTTIKTDSDIEIEKTLVKQFTDNSINVDDEIEKIPSDNNKKDTDDDDSYVFDIETEEEQVEKQPKELPEDIPDLFKTEIFYIDDIFDKEEKSKLERLIRAFNGAVLGRMSNIIDYVITNEESLPKFKDRCSSAKFITASWILQCLDEKKLVPIDKYVLTK